MIFLFMKSHTRCVALDPKSEIQGCGRNYPFKTYAGLCGPCEVFGTRSRRMPRCQLCGRLCHAFHFDAVNPKCNPCRYLERDIPGECQVSAEYPENHFSPTILLPK